METHHQACCSTRTVKPEKSFVQSTNPLLWLPLLLIKGYQYFISPLTGPNCRFYPSCSAYAEEALRTRGLVMGSWLAIKRIFSCHPWHPGGYDPVPQPDKTSEP